MKLPDRNSRQNNQCTDLGFRFQLQVSYDIARAGNLKSMIFGGEGLFLATLKGPGTIWIQSLPFSRLANRIIESAPRAGGQGVEQNSGIMGGLGGAIGGMFSD